MKNLFYCFVTASVLAFTACTTPKVETNQTKVNSSVQTKIETQKGSVGVGFQTNPSNIEAGKNTDLLFTFRNSKGEIVRDLQIVHEKPMHLLIVSEDLDEFYHLHPEPQSDGVYKTSFAFPNGGNYKLYTDFTPLDSTQIVQNFPVNVSGSERAAKELKPDAKLEKTVENLRVVLKPDGELTSNKEMMLNFQIFDAQTNKPVTDLENYLGAKAHFVVINQDLQEFVHAHPMSMDNVKADEHSYEMSGMNMTGEKPHAHGEKLNGAAAESIVSAHITFPKPAIYKIFAQFQRGGKVVTVPFVISVKKGEDEKAVDLKNVKFPNDAFKVIVSKDGFTPQEISLKQGQPLKMAFYRADSENCGSEIVFKDLNIRKKLPVGKIVLIDVPTDKTGEISFACGMDMMRGKIVVQ